MNKNVVLIVTNRDDPHVDYLTPIIKAKGGDFFRFNTEDFPVSIDASITIEQGIKGVLSNSQGQRLTLDRITSVWYRRPVDARPDEKIKDETFKDFIIR